MISRFIDAQRDFFDQALSEISNGKKIGHWMWFIFPQIIGLGSSENAIKYSIKNRQEAVDFINNEILMKRLVEITDIILHGDFDLLFLFGEIDYLKFISCMTLFSEVIEGDSVFSMVIDKYKIFDKKTIKILSKN